MHTTYQLSSAQELNSDILDAIKAMYKTKPIKIIVEEVSDDFELSSDQLAVLENRLNEDESTYLTGEASIAQLKKKYSV